MVELGSGYHAGLVALSVAIAVVSSFVALTVVPRIHDDTAGIRRASMWALVFGISMGAGIWSMHFIAMLAFQLPVAVRYDVSLTTLSLAIGTGFATLGVLPLRRGGKLGGARLLGMGSLMGLGIAGMHYTGMAAMRMPATMTYDTSIVAVSILIAVAASAAALWFADRLRHARVFGELGIKLPAAMAMGLAVSGMHYTGMAAMHFHPLPASAGIPAGLDTDLLVMALVVITMVAQGSVLVMVAMDESVMSLRYLLRHEENQRRLLAILPDGIVVHADDVIVYANPAACRMAGVKEGELIGRMTMDFVHPDSKDALLERMQHVMRMQQPVPLAEERLIRPDGTVLEAEIAAMPIIWDGKPAIEVVIRDISRQRQSEQEAMRLRAAIEQFPDAVFIADDEDRIIYANAACETFYGMDRDALRGEHISCLPVKDADESLYRQIRDRLNSGESWEGELHLQAAERSRAVRRMASPVSHRGKVSYHVCIDHDISEEWHLRAQMEHMQRLESLGVLAGGIAHDFNNLLTAIMGNATLAEQELPEESPALEYIEQIDAASRQAAKLCQQMLAYSGKGKFIVRPLNLSTMVEDTLGLLKASVSKHAELHCRLDKDIRAIDADEAQMQQVLMNLVINASEAIGDEHGLITITTEQKHVGRSELEQAYLDEDLPEGDYVVLEVSDTGCGMDAATREKIFDPFFTTKFTGRGLGMSAIMGIVRGHKGAISVFSEPGGGTTFQMLFPCSQSEASDAVTERTIPGWSGMGTVLVVDDERAIRRVAARMLERMGYQVIEAADGEEGVAVYRQYRDQIAAVLLDMSMPNMDGRQCFHELLRINPDVKVILSSGYNEQEATQGFAARELAGFVQKPYTLKALRGKIREVLG